ncbi:unnamed protein product [Cuscuta campestris]|uniref:Uncharacterized protein n=1 Tax=Cuscuta campestris TaxID=132261 RepID=A0A484KVG9_9ASTE|nr:unnamed protein product [Cuscuta campestris]
MEVSGTQARYNPSPAGSGKCIGKGKANSVAHSCLAACNFTKLRSIFQGVEFLYAPEEINVQRKIWSLPHKFEAQIPRLGRATCWATTPDQPQDSNAR